MYTYVVSTQTYISEKHADDEDHIDEYDELDITYHLKKTWFVTTSVKKVFEIALKYDFGKPVKWCTDEKNVIQEFEEIRQLTPDRPNMTITYEIGHIMKNPKLIGEFVTITQVPFIE